MPFLQITVVFVIHCVICKRICVMFCFCLWSLLHSSFVSTYINPNKPTVHGDYKDVPADVTEFLYYSETIRGLSPRTVNGYYIDLRTFLRYLMLRRGLVPADTELESIDVSKLDRPFIAAVTKEEIYEFLYYVTRQRSNANATRARKLSSLKGFFRYMTVKSNKLEYNPTDDIETPAQKKRLPKYLSLEESITLLKNLQSDWYERDYCILTLFLNCGMRLSELVGMDCNDIGTETVRIIGKGNKERLVYLNDACHFALKQYIDSRAALPNLQDKNALFVSRKTGRRISARRVQQIVSQALQTAGLGGKGYSTHKLRHTAATLMYRFGKVDMLALKEILGHEHVSTTEIYTHISTEQLRNAAKASPLSGIKFTHPEDEPARNKPAGSEEPGQEEEKQEKNQPQSPEAE